MKWSWKLGHIAGIKVQVHWTFLILLAYLALITIGSGESLDAMFRATALVVCVFGCVVLHELGHALTARRYGIETRDITLLPIGGVARLERLPSDPRQEFWVALAGPAVNVAIALALAAIITVTGGRFLPLEKSLGSALVAELMWINIVLVFFNLLPAFPMDGGRVLRSILARRMPYARATELAANVGQAMAILFGIAGIFITPMLLLIALFVYLGAEAESRMVQMKMIVEGVPVRDAMMVRFRSLTPHDCLQRAAEELLDGSQHDFPVLDNGRLVGLLRRQDLVEGLRQGGRNALVKDVMTRDVRTVDERAMLDATIDSMQGGDQSTLPVMRGDTLVGLITLENVGEMLMVRSALQVPSVSASPGDLIDAA